MADHGRTDMATRLIDAPAERLYRAFLDREALEIWLPPQGMSGEVMVLEPRVGGSFRMALRYDDPAAAGQGKTTADTDVVETEYTELDPGERVVHRVRFESADPAFAGDMIMTWRLDPQPGGTKVTFLAENVPEGIGQADHEQGLQSSLDNLAAYVERLQGTAASR